MKIFKRLTVLILALLQLMSVIPVFAGTADENTARVLFKFTGDEKDDSKWAKQVNTYEVTNLGDGYGNVLKVGYSETYAAINQDEPVTSGNVVISFDFKCDTQYAHSYISVAKDRDSSFVPAVSENNGTFYVLHNKDSYMGVTVPQNTLTIKTKELVIEPSMWYHIDLWMNFDTKSIEYYVDGKQLSTEKMNEKLTSFYSFGFLSGSKNNQYCLDNVYIGYVPTGVPSNFEFVKAMTPATATACNVETKYEPLGHIYTDSNIKLTAEIENIKNEKHEVMYEYRAVTKDGHLSYKEEKKISLEPKEKKIIEISFKAKEYGFYDSILTVTEPKSGNYAKRASRFSYIKIRGDGEKSRITGNNSHYHVNRGTVEVDRIQKLLADMGMVEMREGITWAHFEPQIGTYGLTDMQKQFLDAMQENGQNIHLIIGHESIVRKINFPKTDAEIEAWKMYVENLMKALKPYGIRDFEVWNEVDLKYGSGDVTAEEYVRLLKATYPIVHKYVPNARVFAFSCARNYTNFIEECLSIEGCTDNFDGISYHPYDVATRPEVDNFHPVENSFHEYIAEIDGLVEKWNLQDKVLVISEFGYTTSTRYMTEDDQANWTVRASCLAYDHVEYINWFMNVEKIDNRSTTTLSSDAEYHFGWLRAWEKEDILFEAKPVIPAVAQYNAMITDKAESLGSQEILGGKGMLYRYKNHGKDICMAWTIQDEGDFAIDLGVPQAVIYDRFGNSHIRKTVNGILYIRLSENPQYIVGNFAKYDEVPSNAFRIDGNALEAARGDILEIKTHRSIGKDSDYSISVELPVGAEISCNNGFVKGISSIGVKFAEEFVSGSTVKINVLDKDKNIIWQREMPMNIIKSAKTDFAIEYNKSGRWKGVLKVTNTSNKNIHGQLNIEYPEILNKVMPMVKIHNILPKMTRLVEFNMPVSATKDFIDFKGEVVLNNGDKIKIEQSSYFTGLTPIQKSPKIDGVIDKTEYNNSLPLILDKERMVQGIAGDKNTFKWTGTADLSGKGYINYDKDYFYLAMEVEDDIMGSDDPQKRIWSNDSIQFSFAERKVKDAGYTEIGIGIVDDKPAIARYYYMGEKENIVFHDAIGKKDGFEEDTELMISRNGTKTTYELKIPWIDIYPTKEPFNMEDVLFSIIINENDGNGREGWLEFSPGIGNEKNPAVFTNVVVLK